jgi:glycosyltransferase involved in cell wall biosynthesis
MKKTKVLFLSAWYPHRYDAMEGLFVRKHALAANQYSDVCVLFLYADQQISRFEIIEQKTQQLTEIYVYYPFSTSSVFRRLTKLVNYLRAFRKGYTIVKRNWGKPDVTHANILTRTGVLAYILHHKEHIPYVITEHWTRYLDTNYSYTGFLRKKVTEYVVKQAKYILPVSQSLKDAMISNGLYNANYQIIDNVVDDFFYKNQDKISRSKKRILHVSCFAERQKNIKGILHAIKRVSNERNDFEVIIVGTGIDYESVVEEARNLNVLDTIVHFVGEQTPQQVSDWMHQSDFFVLFSNYENCPVVLLESLACGIPIISTEVGNAHELITSKNGRLIPVGDENALYFNIKWMLDNYKTFDKTEIQESAKPFSFEKIGMQLHDIYALSTIRS